jgi:DNA-binding PadR family transcriptional regulator
MQYILLGRTYNLWKGEILTEKFLSRPEEIILLAVWKLKGNAYGVTIRELVREITGKYWSIGSIYVPLERLEKKGLLDSKNSQPVAERGGRRKRMFQLTTAGLRELDELYQMQHQMWEGFQPLSARERKEQ